MSAVPLASVRIEPLELHLDRHAGAGVSWMRNGVEYVRDEGTMPGLSASVAMDVVSAVCGVVAACRMV